MWWRRIYRRIHTHWSLAHNVHHIILSLQHTTDKFFHSIVSNSFCNCWATFILVSLIHFNSSDSKLYWFKFPDMQFNSCQFCQQLFFCFVLSTKTSRRWKLNGKINDGTQKFSRLHRNENKRKQKNLVEWRVSCSTYPIITVDIVLSILHTHKIKKKSIRSKSQI